LSELGSWPTSVGILAILFFTLAIPLEGLADLAARGTLAVFVGINLSLIAIKKREQTPPDGIYVCPIWVPYCGLVSSLLLLGFAWET
jgi:hypothetical protein